MGTKKALTYKEKLRAIYDAVWDTQLTINERKFYIWLTTQDRHHHVFQHYIRGQWNTILKINQKRKK